MFKPMYYKLAGAVCDAIDCKTKEESDKLLIKALNETSDYYANYEVNKENFKNFKIIK